MHLEAKGSADLQQRTVATVVHHMLSKRAENGYFSGVSENLDFSQNGSTSRKLRQTSSHHVT
jgi:hypothetical protein